MDAESEPSGTLPVRRSLENKNDTELWVQQFRMTMEETLKMTQTVNKNMKNVEKQMLTTQKLISAIRTESETNEQ